MKTNKKTTFLVIFLFFLNIIPYNNLNSEVRFIDDSRCQKGYQINKEIILMEKKEKKNLEHKKEKLNEEKKNIYNRNQNTKEKTKEYEEFQKQLKVIEKKILDNKSEFEDLIEKNKTHSCVLTNIKSAIYNTYNKENTHAKSYLLINNDFNTIVAEKKSNMSINPRDFTKYMIISLIDEEIRKGNISVNYKFKVEKEIIPIKGYENLLSMGIKEDKEYYLRDLITAVKYGNFDDALFSICFHLFGGQEKTVKRLNIFLKSINLDDTKIGNIFGLNKNDLPSKPNSSRTTLRDIMKLYQYNKNKNSYFSNNVSYETKTSSFEKKKEFRRDNSMMDKRGNWYYTGVKEYVLSTYMNKEVSGLFDIKKLNQNYSLLVYDSGDFNNLYQDTTEIFKKAINYKYSNIIISRKDDDLFGKILKNNGIMQLQKIRHASSKETKLHLSLKKSLSLNLPVDYIKYLDFKVKINKEKIKVPINKNEKIGELIIYDNKEKKIKLFNKNSIKMDIISSTEIRRKKILNEIFENSRNFFQKWMDSIKEIN